MAKSRTDPLSLDELRAAIRTTQQQLAVLAAAPLPLAEAALEAGIDQLARAYGC